MNEFLIVGLGNPGIKYQATRHNIGFMAIETIALKYKAEDFKNKFQSLLTSFNFGHNKVFLLKPQTYMNLSGQAVLKCASFYKIPKNRIIIIHDDLDLETGRVKIKVGGGHGGHNGLKSIDEAIGKDYMRVRIGISHPKEKGEVSDYVLSDFTTTELKKINIIIAEIAKRLQLLFDGDISRLINFCTVALNATDV